MTLICAYPNIKQLSSLKPALADWFASSCKQEFSQTYGLNFSCLSCSLEATVIPTMARSIDSRSIVSSSQQRSVDPITANLLETEKSVSNHPGKISLPNLDASLLQITYTTAPRPVPEPNSAEVWAQSTCTDHMVIARWTLSQGWEAPEIKPYGPLSMMPTASCLHYATQCFEGMKVFRGTDGKLRLFRPGLNGIRLNISAARVSLPQFPPSELGKLIKALMRIDGPRKHLPNDCRLILTI